MRFERARRGLGHRRCFRRFHNDISSAASFSTSSQPRQLGDSPRPRQLGDSPQCPPSSPFLHCRVPGRPFALRMCPPGLLNCRVPGRPFALRMYPPRALKFEIARVRLRVGLRKQLHRGKDGTPCLARCCGRQGNRTPFCCCRLGADHRSGDLTGRRPREGPRSGSPCPRAPLGDTTRRSTLSTRVLLGGQRLRRCAGRCWPK